MRLRDVLKSSSAGILVTDEEFKVVWANEFEEEFYKIPLAEMIGLWVVDCHKEENKETISEFLEQFKKSQLKEFTKTAGGMVITYSSYYDNNREFAGIVRTRIRMPG